MSQFEGVRSGRQESLLPSQTPTDSLRITTQGCLDTGWRSSAMRRSMILAAVCAMGATAPALAQDTLCDSSVENCRIHLVSLIKNERVGIDVGVWFFKDTRIVQELINAQARGVPIRMLMDVRANLSYPANGPLLETLKAAGIPMRKRTAGDILHWKLMIFAGQGEVEWSGANFSPMAFMAGSPYRDYEDEVIYYSHLLVGSFMTLFDDIWTNTRDYANYANVSGPLLRIHPTFPIDPRLNFRHVELVGSLRRQSARGEHFHRHRSRDRRAE